MTKTHLLNLKRQVEEAKLKSPKRPLYQESVRTGIIHLRKKLSASQISQALGVSESYVEKIKMSAQSSKSSALKDSKKIPELKFLELPQSIVNENLEQPKRLMKVTTSSGASIEVWG